MSKATLGGGQEYERWFWNAYPVEGLSGARLDAVSAVATTVTQTGSDAGRPYEQDVTTTVTTRAFSRAYDWGVGARAGHFTRLHLSASARVSTTNGASSQKQWTGTLTAEKFFAGSPISIALSGEVYRKTGDFEGARNDQRGMLMLRYELGAPKSSFRLNKVSRTVTTTERVPDPNWKAPVAAASANDTAASAGAAAKPQETTTDWKSASRVPTPTTRTKPTLTSVQPG